MPDPLSNDLRAASSGDAANCPAADASPGTFDIEVCYDGACPLCRREVALPRRLDRRHRVVTTDIASAAFRPTAVGRSYEALMARIHGRLPDGTWVEGVEVFRRLYAAVGFARLAALSRRPLLSRILDVCYAAFARNRLRLTGRCDGGQCPVRHSSAAAR